MWFDVPENRLTDIKQHQIDLRSEGASNRLGETSSRAQSHGFHGLRVRVGSVLIVVGRTLCDDEIRLLNTTH